MEINASQTKADLEARRQRRLISEYHDTLEPDVQAQRADLPAWADALTDDEVHERERAAAATMGEIYRDYP